MADKSSEQSQSPSSEPTGGAPEPQPPSQQPRSTESKSNLPVWLGLGVAILTILAVTGWTLFSPRDIADPVVNATPTALPATAVVQITPTTVAGAATFTPVAGNVITGPHVLGITAGVGMSRGDIAGPAPIAVTFSDEMDQPSAQSAFALAPAVKGSYKWQQSTLLFTPDSPLQPSTSYTVTVSKDAKTKGGSLLAAPMSASFQTAPPPSVLRTLPSAGASEVPTDAVVTISFNRPMIPLTALDSQPDPGQWVTISPAVAGRWVWLGTAAVGFRADSGFVPATGYTVEVKAGWPDAAGVTLSQGTTVNFNTVKPAILSVQPGNGASGVPLDMPVIVQFNMPMHPGATQSAFTLSGPSTVPGTFAWSPDGTVMTFTAASLLSFSTEYRATFSGQVQPAQGVSTELTGGASTNTWTLTTTDSTRVLGHYPDGINGPVQPSTIFGFSFNNPLAPNQSVEQYFTVDPQPEGYKGQLAVSENTVYTDQIKLLPNTTYKFALKEGLKDKWGFPVAPDAWEAKIGPLPPSLAIKGGVFQPVYAGGPSRVRIDAANLSSIKMQVRQLSEADIRAILQNPPYYQPTPTLPGQLKREWDLPVPGGAQPDETTTFYPTIALDANTDRLPVGYYLLVAQAPTPYSEHPLYSTSVLIVGRTGVVTKAEGQNLLVWTADLSTGKPVANYPLRIQQLRMNAGPVEQQATTGQDGVVRIKLNEAPDRFSTAIWSANSTDALFATTGWTNNLDPWSFGVAGAYGVPGYRAALYVDRPIYRPAQVVYFRGIYRLDDDATYTLPKAGETVNLHAWIYGNLGPTVVYTGTAALSASGTINGQFTLPADAPSGSYTLSFTRPGTQSQNIYDGGVATVGFQVEEYRKPDFQVGVEALPEAVKGDTITATVRSSYYFGGPLGNVTTTVNVQQSPHYFGWADPDTDETYTFGEYAPPYIYDYYRSVTPFNTPEPVQTFQSRTDRDGVLVADITRYITTTSGSKSVLIEGQVQDLSNQAVADSTNTVVHQGLFYVGLRAEDYIATAQQATTITVRTVQYTGKGTQPNTAVSLRFVRYEWEAPSDPLTDQWTMKEVPVGQGAVTTNDKGRATFQLTPPAGGEFGVIGESIDSRGNRVRTVMHFYASDQGSSYIPWRYTNEQQVQLVADKETYNVGDTARILVTSPFSQATGLLTVERGHVKRYRLVNITGGAPTIEVPLEAGDLPNVYIGLTLLGPGQLPTGAPADWANRAIMRQGYVNLTLDTSGKELSVTIQPEGKGPFTPGSTANVKVTARDKAGKPLQGELSLAVVDEAIFAIGGDNTPGLFGSFWGERGLSVSTSSSFTAGDFGGDGRGGGGFAAGSEAMPSAAPAAGQDGAKRDTASQVANTAQQAPKKVRADFRDTAFWTATVTTGPEGSAIVPVPLPDNLTTWRLTAAGITGETLAGTATTPMTVTQPLLLRPILPRFLTAGDKPHPQAIIHNNTANDLDLVVSLEVSGSVTLDKSPAAEQTLKVPAGQQAVVTWNASVDKGNTANFRFWVRTTPPNGTFYLEDAVAATLPVKPFAAPEAVATSGEVAGVRADETVFIPYSVDPLLGELVVQVSPSLAAATTDSLMYVKEYEYESTDQTVSRFLPLVVLEKTYNDQGLTTPYSKDIPGIMQRSLTRLANLQQPDGGWAWWERGPSTWFETAYAVQGLTEAQKAGYAVPGDMLQRGVERLRQFQADSSTEGIDATYNLNMRAYSLYVLAEVSPSGDEMRSQATALLQQAPRLSTHALAWLALAMNKLGMSNSQSLLDSLVSGAKQTSTTAHWEESIPDYWSMGTDTRATALAIDALVTLQPNDPIVPKAVRWLMTAEREGHWLSTQETSISLIALAHYMAQSKELSADYVWQVDAFGKVLGQGRANSTTLTQTQTLRLSVSDIPTNTLGNLGLARSAENGKMYYQVSLRYYVPGEGIKSRSEGLAITRSYYTMVNGVAGTQPVSATNAGDLLKVRLTVVVPETSYYVLVTDPLPAGLEGVNGSLNTTSFTERPPNPMGIMQPDPNSGGGSYYDSWYWRWGPFDNVEMRDDRTVLFATYMAPGTYVYEYYARATTPGRYLSLPAHAELLYYPDVFGHSDGGEFTVR